VIKGHAPRPNFAAEINLLHSESLGRMSASIQLINMQFATPLQSAIRNVVATLAKSRDPDGFQGKLPGAPPATDQGLRFNPAGQTVDDLVSQVTWLADANLAA
jgi:hypothetical protein